MSYIEEFPEKEELVEEIIDQKPKKKRVKTRVLKPELGDKKEITEIVTVQEEDKKPQATITITIEATEELKLLLRKITNLKRLLQSKK